MFCKVTIKGFLKKLSSKNPVPGGGSAAALAGAQAAGLVAMAAKFSKDKKIAKKAERLMKVLMSLITKDAEAFEKVMEAHHLSKVTEKEKEKREKEIEKALKYAAEIPLQTARYSYEVLKLAEFLLKDCNPSVITDLGIAALMAQAAVEGAILNVKVNLASIKDKKFKKEINKAVENLYLTGYQTRVITSRVQGKIANSK